MGNDGGSIPRRDELVRTKKKPEKVDKDYELQAKWQHCAITQRVLQLPIVGCELGRLYNKDAVIEFFLDKTISDSCQHIRTLKDVKELKLTINPAYDQNDNKRWIADAYYDHQDSRFICPIIGLEMNGRHKFCFLWRCGCVLSERALKELHTKQCPSCNKDYMQDDVIIINATAEDFDMQEQQMKKRRLALKLEKKQKRKVVEVDAASLHKPAVKLPATANKISLKNEALVNSTINDAVIYGAAGAARDIMQKKALEPKSKVFKSIFTTSGQEHTKRENAHWVTYDPYNL